MIQCNLVVQELVEFSKKSKSPPRRLINVTYSLLDIATGIRLFIYFKNLSQSRLSDHIPD
jgi:hypothetical protein